MMKFNKSHFLVCACTRNKLGEHSVVLKAFSFGVIDLSKSGTRAAQMRQDSAAIRSLLERLTGAENGLRYFYNEIFFNEVS